MKKLLLATTAVLGLAAAPGIAHATLTYTIVTGIDATTNPATLMANPAGFAGIPGSAHFISTMSNVDALNFNNTTATGGAAGTLGAFFGFSAYPLNPPLIPADAALQMSNAGNTNTTFIRVTENYNGTGAPITSTLFHDDGATIFVDGLDAAHMVCGTPQPQSVGPGNPCSFPSALGPHMLTLYYEESFALPAVLSVTLPTEAVPEPASLALLGSALVGFGLLRRRRRTS